MSADAHQKTEEGEGRKFTSMMSVGPLDSEGGGFCLQFVTDSVQLFVLILG
jgi:hypothetical protein